MYSKSQSINNLCHNVFYDTEYQSLKNKSPVHSAIILSVLNLVTTWPEVISLLEP